MGQNAFWFEISVPQCVQYTRGLHGAGRGRGIVGVPVTQRKNNLKIGQRRLAAIVLLILCASALALLRWNHPHNVSAIPECPSQSIAGVYCPGCGSLRATHHLLNGRVSDSLAQNPLTLLVGVPTAALGLIVLACWARERPLPAWLASRGASWTLVGAGAILLLFGVVRNIDASWADPLRPADQSQSD